MRPLIVLSLLLGCSGTPMVDGGTPGGGAGGGTSGGRAAGGTTAGGSTAGGSSSSGTLTGPDAIQPQLVTSFVMTTDAGLPFFMVVTYYDRAMGTACAPVVAPPVIGVQLTLQTTDAGRIELGPHAIGGLNYGRRQALVPGGDTAYFTGGTATLTRLDATRSVGSFSTTLLYSDGGTAAISGTWDTPACPL